MSERGQCPVCRYSYRLRADGTVMRHHGYIGHDPQPDCRGCGMMPLSGDSVGPRRIVVAGDWHGDTDWAVHVIRMAAKMLRDDREPLVLQLGDFGVWPGEAGAKYIADLEKVCHEHGVAVWFVDGNHEDFTAIGQFDPWMSGHRHLTHLPRGWRWEWHGRTWLALGGGVSLDKAVRKEDVSWWPEEEITDEQEQDAIAGGRAHVMVTHDVPSAVMHTFPPPPRFWDVRDLARNDAHRERLQRITSEIRPGWLMHGHLHRAYQRVCDLGYGDVEVTGLDCNDGDGPNYAVLDVKLMRWDEAG